MGKTYNNPPIVEALCEFQFVPGQEWDITIPELMYEQIGDEFSEKQQASQMDIGIRLDETEGQVMRKVYHRMQFLKKDRSALIQLVPDVLIINHLKPYPTWHQFQVLILKNLQTYEDIAHPNGFNRIGLRYINRIEIPKSVLLEEYFQIYPLLPEELSGKYGGISIKVDTPYESGRDSLTIILTRDISSLLLDINYAMIIPERVSLETIEEWLEIAHKRIEEAFEECITDKCRMLFAGGE